MARYTVRVVLHNNASREDYERLKSNLAAIRVVDCIKADEGTWWVMPPAEYDYEGAAAIGDVLDAVYRVAHAVQPNPSVFVTEAGGRLWRGCTPRNPLASFNFS